MSRKHVVHNLVLCMLIALLPFFGGCDTGTTARAQSSQADTETDDIALRVIEVLKSDSEFLALVRGEPGEQGLQGEQGEKGEQGLAGEDGTDGGVTIHADLDGLEQDSHPQYVARGEPDSVIGDMLEDGSITDPKLVSVAPEKITPQGPGSGFDADTLDGFHASEIAGNPDIVVSNHGALSGLEDDDHQQYVLRGESDSITETMLQDESVTDEKLVSVAPATISPQGPGSGLDADTLDGLDASELGGFTDHADLDGLDSDDHPQYVLHDEANAITQSMLASGSVTNAKIVSVGASKITPQGAGSGLDADTLDGLHASEIATSDDVWKLDGNSGTTPGTDVLGTTDNVALQIDVNGQRALLLQPNTTSPNHIAGHSANSVTGGVSGAAIGGGGQSGFGNVVSGNFGTIAGGRGNDASVYAAVCGGVNNTASGERSLIGGGTGNTASNSHAVVAGGDSNSATGIDATVGGGFQNTASGQSATVPGGEDNTASGNYSVAAGRRATASHNGSVVWGDSENAAVASSAANQWTARMQGGYRLFTNSNLSTGVQLAAGSGSWSSVSDRGAKENPEPVNAREILRLLATVPITRWNYKSQKPDVRHIGPMAQDFHAAFGVGPDERHITTIDADGVAFAAIQALYEIVEGQQERIAGQQEQLERLESRLQAFQNRAAKP